MLAPVCWLAMDSTVPSFEFTWTKYGAPLPSLKWRTYAKATYPSDLIT